MEIITGSSNISKSLKSRIQNGEVVYGMSLLSFSSTIAEIAGYASYDFVFIDMEHGPGGIPQALPCVLALAATQTPVIFRVPENSPVWVRKALTSVHRALFSQ